MFECDVRADFFAWSEPVARKEHKCCECSAPILKGEKHYHGRGKWEGTISVFRQHILCCEACMLIRDTFNDDCIPFGTLKDYYDEYRSDMATGRHPDEFRELVRLMTKIRRRERQAKSLRSN